MREEINTNAMTEEEAQEYLAHYGVLGMKWGVRKDRRTGVRKGSPTRGTKRAKRKQARAEKRQDKRFTSDMTGGLHNSKRPHMMISRSISKTYNTTIRDAMFKAKVDAVVNDVDSSRKEFKQSMASSVEKHLNTALSQNKALQSPTGNKRVVAKVKPKGKDGVKVKYVIEGKNGQKLRHSDEDDWPEIGTVVYEEEVSIAGEKVPSKFEDKVEHAQDFVNNWLAHMSE